ncbi:MAG: hypothetical protein AAGB24_05725 [Bacteroidota bacterium]
MTKRGKKIKKYFAKGLLQMKIKDEEFDRLIKEAIHPLFRRALEKTMVYSEDCISESRIIYGLNTSNSVGIEFQFKMGKDGYFRYIPIVVTILNFTSHEVVIYQSLFDPTVEKAFNECTRTYFYEDVVSIETREVAKTREKLTPVKKALNKLPVVKVFVKGNEEQYNASKKFILKTRGNASLEVQLSDYETIGEVNGTFKITDAENTIRAIRTTLSDMKRKRI